MQQPIEDYALMPKPRQALAGPKPGASKAIAGGYGGELLLQRLKLGSARKWGWRANGIREVWGGLHCRRAVPARRRLTLARKSLGI
jgi:hypothetical protein